MQVFAQILLKKIQNYIAQAKKKYLFYGLALINTLRV